MGDEVEAGEEFGAKLEGAVSWLKCGEESDRIGVGLDMTTGMAEKLVLIVEEAIAVGVVEGEEEDGVEREVADDEGEERVGKWVIGGLLSDERKSSIDVAGVEDRFSSATVDSPGEDQSREGAPRWARLLLREAARLLPVLFWPGLVTTMGGVGEWE